MSCPLIHNGSVKEAGVFGIKLISHRICNVMNPTTYLSNEVKIVIHKSTRMDDGCIDRRNIIWRNYGSSLGYFVVA